MNLDLLTYWLQMIGTVAFALTGAMTAMEKELDVLGFIVVGAVTAVGGGALRDILLGVLPPKLFTYPPYLTAAVATSLLFFLIMWLTRGSLFGRVQRLNPVINVFDAIGLGIFAVAGAQAAMEAGWAEMPLLVLFLGTVTGVGGGLMRDQLVGNIPMVLKKRVYALAALIGAGIYYGMMQLLLPEVAAILAGTGSVILIRLLASHYRWNLPRVRLREEAKE